MKVLITGNLGAIGSVLVPYLESKRIEVVGFDQRYPLTHPFYGALSDVGALAKALAGCDGVIHLAAVSRVADAERQPELAWKSNVDGTRNLINALKGVEKKWVIFASSREVYGEMGDAPVDEAVPTKPKSLYGSSKKKAEELLQAWGGPSWIFRFGNVYGSQNDLPQRLIPSLARGAAKREPLQLCGPQRRFDFVYVEDVCRAIHLGMVQLYSLKGPEVINIATGTAYSLEQVAWACKGVLRSSSLISTQTAQLHEMDNFVADVTKAQRVLGWAPQVDLKQGIRIYLKQRFKEAV